MRATVYRYVCASCQRAFHSPGLSHFAYGQFLLCASSGEVAALEAFEDASYQELSTMLTAHPRACALSAAAHADLLQRLYGPLVCDPSATGQPFAIDAQPACPGCGSQRPASWDVASPPQAVEVAPVTHRRWNALTGAEKQQLLDAALR